jgi:hypothetical protein
MLCTMPMLYCARSLLGLNGAPRPEVFAYGMRNPWKCTFDRADAVTAEPELWCADVGQNKVEKVQEETVPHAHTLALSGMSASGGCVSPCL